ncbi:site-specific DNA-methyltransferase [Staphylococcus sp. SQ8-PEA]|uniref:Site-specific DNA-methyltransferase n=1 Tax=Staphylococcus marylandisciuri TaxID=2981529 RepID=A0ABT2QSL1_9STAP|nr:site-specific DNA-methyltransferase [Staphylococcus marylandisciuri]MCU5746959.1 site-specific DNA-methyltransferase [Staphylococcus marylandisciuri]
MSANILDEISKILSGVEKYWINEKLAKQIIIEDLRNNDTKLISKLLANKSINETYVQDIDGYKVFDKEAFISLLRYKNYWQDSYTKYANKIGLTAEGKYLNYNSDVVLNFPFKDCVLEGGMTKEDSILKNDEKFYNEVIAKEEIDTLLAPKVFTNIKKYNIEGPHVVDNIDYKENLIIKGNNLLALHSLKEKYKDSIKLIYIDPPYNTNGDSFVYNDRFNHSTWLTFIKNRLELAKNFMSDEGIIMIQCDDNEQAYLKVLADEIFGRENFINNLAVIMNLKGNQDQFAFAGTHEYVLVYSKNKEKAEFYQLSLKNSEKLEQWNQDEIGFYKKGANLKATGVNAPRNKRPNLFYPIFLYEDGTISTTEKNGYKEKILPITNGQEMSWRWQKSTLERNIKDVIIVKTDDNVNLYKKQRPEVGDLPSHKPKTLMYKPAYSSGNGTNQIKNLFKEKKFNFAKPEELIKDFIEITTKEKDIVLDFFMGSATTQAVAHKMNRQYIGIEQMDYINAVSVPRLQKVIEGEQGGISKDVDWQGGGSFVYAELAKENQEIVDRIISSSTKEELSQQIDKLLNDGVLNYEVDFDKFTNTKKEFSELELEDQKEVLIRILDNNQLYVNYSDVEDSVYNFTEDEIAFNHSFYGGV